MSDILKRSSGGDGGLTVLFISVNTIFFLPFFVFFFYTLAQILPTIAVVADPNATTYTDIPLSDLYSETASSPIPQPSFLPKCFPQIINIRPIFNELRARRTRFKSLALVRGLTVSAPLTLCEFAIAILSIQFLPAVLAPFPQILLPLALVQFYTLWTHVVLTFPSEKSTFKRILSFRETLRITGPALATYLTAKAVLKSALVAVYNIPSLMTHGDISPTMLGSLLLTFTVIQIIALIPAHVVLTRIQASLIPIDEKTIVGLDWALRGEREGKDEAVGMSEAWREFGWGAWGRLVVLYGFVFVVCVVGGGGLVLLDFIFLVTVGLMQMGF